MSLPKSVQTQANAAADHFKTPVENPEDTVTDPTPAPEPEAKKPEPAPPVEDATPSPDPQPVDPPKDAPKDTEDRDAIYWRHRHDVIQGKYNKEVPALHAEVKQLKQALADKDKQLETLSSQATPGNAGTLTDEQVNEFRETFGEELVDFVERMMARQAPAPTPNQDVESLRQDVEQMKQEKLDHLKAQFWTDLKTAVPNWQTINADPAFLQYLGQPVPHGGYTDEGQPVTFQRQLDQASAHLDAQGVIDIFKRYLQQATPAPEKRDIPPQEVEPRATRATDPTPQGRGAKVWTGAEITQFYTDKAAGRYAPEQAQRLEADIFAAQKEGRIRR